MSTCKRRIIAKAMYSDTKPSSQVAEFSRMGLWLQVYSEGEDIFFALPSYIIDYFRRE